MPGLLTIIIPVGAALAVGAVLLVFFLRGKRGRAARGGAKDRARAMRQARRRLNQNPNDLESLGTVAQLTFEEEDYRNARRHYESLLHHCPANPELNEFEITTRLAISCLELRDLKEAYKNFVVARKLNEESFEVNFHLGYLEYLRKRYETASALLRKAQQARPDHQPAVRYLGLCLTRRRHYPEAARTLSKAIEEQPDDKEAQFALGQCFYQMGLAEKALQIFRHLRGDPKYGPRASLYAGTIRAAGRQYPEAAEDFEIGLRHGEMAGEIRLELQYRLATVLLHQQHISRALGLLKRIAGRDPSYKNVSELIEKYQELAVNENLQAYLIAPKSDFVALCRRIAGRYFTRSRTRVVDIAIAGSDHVDVLAEVDTEQWEDQVLFRFSRSDGSIGEFAMRELHTRARDLKAGRALYLSAGDFSEGAKRYVEARLIDLVDRDQLLKLLGRLQDSEGGEKPKRAEAAASGGGPRRPRAGG